MDIDLNCDLGEGCPWDADLMPLITSANIACGFHAGDPATAAAALAAAARHGVQVGAHPGFADREHFGRRELDRSEEQIFQDCVYQVGALAGLARAAGLPVRHVKPHGALYNRACRDDAYARPVVAAAALSELAVIGLPGSRLQAQSAGRCPFVGEGFADRRYLPDGSLVPRSRPDALIEDAAEAARQVEWLLSHPTGGSPVRTICVHGDNPQALEFVRRLHRTDGSGSSAGALARMNEGNSGRQAPHGRRRVVPPSSFIPQPFPMTLRVLDPGLFSLVVDFGRPCLPQPGRARAEAPWTRPRWCWAMRRRQSIQDASPRNDPGGADPPGRLCGGRGRLRAPFPLASDRQRLAPGTTFVLAPGEELRIGTPPVGLRAYLCIQGGLHTRRVLGSGSASEPLVAGAELPCSPGQIARRFIRPVLDSTGTRGRSGSWTGPRPTGLPPLTFTRVPFSSAPPAIAWDCAWTHEPLARRLQRELLSEPVCPGSVQVTHDGRCIILGVDGQTIGGYPKLAQVISADLDKVGQLRPGDEISFVRVELAEAERSTGKGTRGSPNGSRACGQLLNTLSDEKSR